jgi:hypothetical protein
MMIVNLERKQDSSDLVGLWKKLHCSFRAKNIVAVTRQTRTGKGFWKTNWNSNRQVTVRQTQKTNNSFRQATHIEDRDMWIRNFTSNRVGKSGNSERK